MMTPSITGRFRDRLLIKQAVATLAIAMVLGVVTSLWELAAEWRAEREMTATRMTQVLSLVRGTAAEAAFQLSTDIGREVVQGIADDKTVLSVTLNDNFGMKLSQAGRKPVYFDFPVMAERLMGDVTHYDLMLETKGLDAQITRVGTLVVDLDANQLTLLFLDRVWRVMGIGMLRALLFSIMVVIVFHRLITRPLLNITNDIAGVDPARPAARSIQTPLNHDGDELGALASTVNDLLARFQQGLSERDRAERDLSALAHDLEVRVVERTADLARANQSVNDGIRYAARLQGALLPPQNALDGVVADWAVGWQPLDQVGGDFYWAGTFGGKGVVAVMDCTGHGVPGAFMSAVASSALGRVLHHMGHEDPAQILGGINVLVKAALHQDGSGGMGQGSNDGLDAAICVIDPGARQIRFAGAGLSLVARLSGVQRFIGGDKMGLGYADCSSDHRFQTRIIDYRPGDTFVMFTDGVTDQVGGPNRRLLGRKRVEAIMDQVSDRPLTEQIDLLQRRLEEWRGPEHPRDDLTVLAFSPI